MVCLCSFIVISIQTFMLKTFPNPQLSFISSLCKCLSFQWFINLSQHSFHFIFYPNSYSLFPIKKCLFSLCVHACVWECRWTTQHYTCGGHRTTYGSHFFPITLWDQGVVFSSAGLCVSTCTCQPTLLSCNSPIRFCLCIYLFIEWDPCSLGCLEFLSLKNF